MLCDIAVAGAVHGVAPILGTDQRTEGNGIRQGDSAPGIQILSQAFPNGKHSNFSEDRRTHTADEQTGGWNCADLK